MTVLAWPHQRKPLEIMKEYMEITGMNSARTEQKHKASYMKITAKGGSYITKNEKGGCMSKMKQREK
jgi:hypothetical protein